MPHVIAVANQKGGPGKTTVAVQLARAGVRAGHRVLLVDADPQGNATKVTTADPLAPDDAGLADVLSTRAPETIRDVIVAGVWDGLDVLPTTGPELGAVRDELVIAGPGREGRLRQALRDVEDDYDLVFIDCGPSLDQLTINALTAADGLVIVTAARLFAMDGLAQLLETVDAVRTHYQPDLKVAGVIVNMLEANTVSGRGWLVDLEEATTARGLPLLTPHLPRAIALADATEAGAALDKWGTKRARELAATFTTYLTSIEGALA